MIIHNIMSREINTYVELLCCNCHCWTVRFCHYYLIKLNTILHVILLRLSLKVLLLPMFTLLNDFAATVALN